MINEKILDEAILEHHKKRLMRELRNQMIYGDNDMSQIYGLYLTKLNDRKVARGDRIVRSIGIFSIAFTIGFIACDYLLRATQ